MGRPLQKNKGLRFTGALLPGEAHYTFTYCGGVVLDPVPVPVLPVPVPVPLPVLEPVPVELPVLEPVPVELPVLLPLMPELPLVPMLSFVLILQVSESIFTSVTLKVPLDMLSVPDEVAVAEELDPPFSHIPFTVISCPTCAETS